MTARLAKISAFLLSLALWPVPALPAPTACGIEIEGLDALAKGAAGKAIVIGEMHGTREVPAAVAGLACLLARHHERVLVGLEIPETMATGFLEPFYAAADAQAGMALATSHPFWTARESQDGRSSVAMLDLLESLRPLVRLGKVDILAFDRAVPEDGAADRDLLMAQAIEERRADADALLILTGNIHAMKRVLHRGEWTLVPMASHLPAEETISLNAIALADGEAWNCQSDGCGAHANPGWRGRPGVPDAPALVLDPEADGRYDGMLFLATSTAAPPLDSRASDRK